MLRLVSDVFPMLMLYSWRTFRLLSPVLSGWIYTDGEGVWMSFIALVQLVLHVCWLCSVCHIVYQKRFLFFVIW